MGFIAAELKPVRLGELEDGKQHLSAGLRVDRSSEAKQNKNVNVNEKTRSRDLMLLSDYDLG
jgi:hypothetical protein